GEHLLEPRTDLALADLLGAALDPLGRLVDLGLVGGVGGTAGQRYRGEECESDPRRVKFRFHDAPPSAGLVCHSILPPARFPRCPGSCRLPENFLSASMTLCPDGPVTGLTAGRGAYAQRGDFPRLGLWHVACSLPLTYAHRRARLCSRIDAPRGAAGV